MKDELFADLMESAGEALDHARGKRELRTTKLLNPPEPMSSSDVKRLRASTRASQAVFAHYLNVSTKLVQAWEARRREPEGAALRLLRLAERYPDVVFQDAPPKSEKRPSTKQARGRARSPTAKRPAKRARAAFAPLIARR
jgi:putative transcriptional regulator